jgi:DNA-binding NtrC family response regulator
MSLLDDARELSTALPERTWTRRAERRAGLRRVIAALAVDLSRCYEDRDLRGIFEHEVRQLVPSRQIRLREIPTRYQARLVTPARTPESVLLDVPTTDPGRQGVLEAVLDPACSIDEWDFEMLSAAAHLGALVLEANRARYAPVPLGVRRPEGAAPLIGSTPVMQALRERVERVASTDFTVLVEGESGSGKELVARQLHDLSRRRHGPFVAVNCAAVVETLLEAELFGIEDRTATGVRGRRGKFEHADGGTIFLDEVSDLSLLAQAKLLRAIQDLSVERVGGQGIRRLDTRVVVATNRPLRSLVSRGLFRTDLYYRLSGVEIHVPPLRSRPDDILELARYFLARHRNTRYLTLSDDACDALRLYMWPGNVRELERLMERAVALAESNEIEIDDLPPQVRGEYNRVITPSVEAGDSMRAWGSRYARLVWERCGRNKRRACKALDISYHTLQGYLHDAERLQQQNQETE